MIAIGCGPARGYGCPVLRIGCYAVLDWPERRSSERAVHEVFAPDVIVGNALGTGTPVPLLGRADEIMNSGRVVALDEPEPGTHRQCFKTGQCFKPRACLPVILG